MKISIGRPTPHLGDPLTELRPVTIGDETEAFLVLTADFVWSLQMIRRWKAYENHLFPSLEAAETFLKLHFGDVIDPKAARNLSEATGKLKLAVETTRNVMTGDAHSDDTVLNAVSDLMTQAENVIEHSTAVLDTMSEPAG